MSDNDIEKPAGTFFLSEHLQKRPVTSITGAMTIQNSKVTIRFNDNYKKNTLREGFKKKKKYGIFHTLVGWVGLKKSFSIKNKNKKHGLKMPKIA
jgi:hypothetical protein